MCVPLLPFASGIVSAEWWLPESSHFLFHISFLCPNVFICLIFMVQFHLRYDITAYHVNIICAFYLFAVIHQSMFTRLTERFFLKTLLLRPFEHRRSRFSVQELSCDHWIKITWLWFAIFSLRYSVYLPTNCRSLSVSWRPITLSRTFPSFMAMRTGTDPTWKCNARLKRIWRSQDPIIFKRDVCPPIDFHFWYLDPSLGESTLPMIVVPIVRARWLTW